MFFIFSYKISYIHKICLKYVIYIYIYTHTGKQKALKNKNNFKMLELKLWSKINYILHFA